MTTILLSLIGPLIFFVFKAANSGIRFSDTNVYFYTAQELLKNHLLYKDVFFTNLPLFPYISAFYSIIIGNKLNLYYLTAAIECAITSLLLFYYAHKKSKNILTAIMVQTIYLFSFIILSTSDHQTGVFLASLFSVIAFLLLDKRWYFFSGLFLGLMVVSKAYYLPVGCGIILYSFLCHRNESFKLLMGFFISISICILPVIILTPKNFIQDVFQYSLFRSQGVNKINLFIFFISHDLILACLFIYSFLNYKKNLLLFFIILFSALTVLFYKDVYYLYLNMMVPFLTLSFMDLVQILTRKKTAAIGIFIGAGTCLLIGTVVYVNRYASLQKITNIDDYIEVIQKEKPRYLYGTMEITPALAYLANIPLLNNIVDTNENLFNSHKLNATILTKQAINSKTIIVSKGVFYPAENIINPLMTSAIDSSQVKEYCSQLQRYPITSEGVINAIFLFKCY